MRRTKNKQENNDGKVWWRKLGSGSFTMGNGKIVKPNERFRAKPEDIPNNFRDVVIPLDQLPEEKPPVTQPLDQQYKIETKSPGWYNIVDVNGKIINEKALRDHEAKEMLVGLTK